MAITYPLTIPGPLGEAEANLKKYDAVGETISPFAGSAQQQQWQDQHWELDLVWPEMTWPQFAALDAFAGALHGKFGSFVWSPPQAVNPLGSGLGSPVANALSNVSGSSTIVTTGWTPNAVGVLLPGDFLSATVTPGLPRLYQYVGQGPLTASVIGGATIDIFPSIRETMPPNITQITIHGPLGTFRLAENRREAPQKKTKTFIYQLKAREAI
jgi:hypothetical protein